MGKGSWVFLLLAVVVVNLLVDGVYGYHGDERERDERGWWPGDEGDRGRREEEGGGGGGGGGGRRRREEEGGGGGGGGGGRRRGELRTYILDTSKSVVSTDAGAFTVVKGGQFEKSEYTECPMHIGFLTMEPNSMFVPQYLDSSVILFVQKGEARIGSIYKDELVENDLRAGDLYRIQAGSAFYVVNTAQGQRLHIIASIDTSESSDWHSYEPFFIGGGTRPASVLAGFDTQTLSAALNVSNDMVDKLLSIKHRGAIVHLRPDGESGSQTSVWKRFMEQGKQERGAHMKRILHVGREEEEEEEKPTWSWRKLLISVFGKSDDKNKLEAYNIYDRDPDFQNDYGWSLSVGKKQYKQLKKSDFSVYLVNLTAGAMMGPHLNPRAIEYGIVLSGTGNIQVVYPNGTIAMDATVTEGEVFYIPRYYPFCQVASRTGPFVFFGFTTSSHNNHPQFFVGKGGLLQLLLGPELAASLGMTEEKLKEIVYAQNQTTIFPATSASPGGGGEIPEGGGGSGEEFPEEGGGGEGGGGGQSPSLRESEIRMKKSSLAYDMAMGLVD